MSVYRVLYRECLRGCRVSYSDMEFCRVPRVIARSPRSAGGARLVLGVWTGECAGHAGKGIACVFRHRALIGESGKFAVPCRVAR